MPRPAVVHGGGALVLGTFLYTLLAVVTFGLLMLRPYFRAQKR